MNPFAHHSRDKNEPEVIEALTAAGYVVVTVSPSPGKYGAGAPDLIVWSERGQRFHVVEVKNPATHARRKGGSRSQATQDALRALLGDACPFHVVTTGHAAVVLIRAYDEAHAKGTP